MSIQPAEKKQLFRELTELGRCSQTEQLLRMRWISRFSERSSARIVARMQTPGKTIKLEREHMA